MKKGVLLSAYLVWNCFGYGQGIPVSIMFRPKPLTEFNLTDTNILRTRQQKLIPENFYTKGLGFFCRQEIKMEHAHVPVTFRLGSMDYCNRLEQKPGYRE